MAKAQEEKTTDPMVKRMEELEAQLQAANERAQNLEAKELTGRMVGDSESYGASRGPRANTADEPSGVDGGYLFEVRCNDATAGLPTKTVRCCDESEAIRWYAVTTPHPAQPGKALDTAKYRCIATCKEESVRQARIMLERKKAFLRTQLDNGKDLSEADLKLIGVL